MFCFYNEIRDIISVISNKTNRFYLRFACVKKLNA